MRGEGPVAGLRADYERVALSGLKRIPDALDSDGVRSWSASLDRLVRAGLAATEGDALTLHRPEYATVALDEETSELLRLLYAAWLRAEDDDEVLHGELGFWQHWWNALHSGGPGELAPLRMDLVVDAGFAARRWLMELDAELLGHVIDRGLISGRVIVGPGTLESPAEGIVDLGLAVGFEVRVLATVSPLAIYNGTAAVVAEPAGDGSEAYRLTRRRSLVQPLQRLFELQWASAIPWIDYGRGAAGVLHLMAQGWSDASIAEALRLSERTVSRRVAEAMAAAGARTRFELGVRYALSGLSGIAPEAALGP